MTDRVDAPLILRTVAVPGSVALAAPAEGRLIAYNSCMSSPSIFLLNSMVSSQLCGFHVRPSPGDGRAILRFGTSSDAWLKLKLQTQPNVKHKRSRLWNRGYG